MTGFRQQLGAELRRLRTARGLRLADIAAAAHVSTGYVSEVERGAKEPSSEIIEAICGALGVSVTVSVSPARR